MRRFNIFVCKHNFSKSDQNPTVFTCLKLRIVFSRYTPCLCQFFLNYFCKSYWKIDAAKCRNQPWPSAHPEHGKDTGCCVWVQTNLNFIQINKGYQELEYAWIKSVTVLSQHSNFPAFQTRVPKHTWKQGEGHWNVSCGTLHFCRQQVPEVSLQSTVYDVIKRFKEDRGNESKDHAPKINRKCTPRFLVRLKRNIEHTHVHPTSEEGRAQVCHLHDCQEVLGAQVLRHQGEAHTTTKEIWVIHGTWLINNLNSNSSRLRFFRDEKIFMAAGAGTQRMTIDMQGHQGCARGDQFQAPCHYHGAERHLHQRDYHATQFLFFF